MRDAEAEADREEPDCHTRDPAGDPQTRHDGICVINRRIAQCPSG
jgi:hypothetical protein